eukprot:8778813-Alexandrium_andersonii.AAC.1
MLRSARLKRSTAASLSCCLLGAARSRARLAARQRVNQHRAAWGVSLCALGARGAALLAART